MLQASEWEFNTWQTIGGSRKLKGGSFAITAGSFTLTSPDKGKTEFPFGALGRSVGKDLAGDVIPFLKNRSIGFAPEDFPSTGVVYMLPQFDGDDLAEDDFTGVMLLYELSVASAASATGSLMLLGGSFARFALLAADTGASVVPGVGSATIAAMPPLLAWFLHSFKAGLIMATIGDGSAVGASASGYLGYATNKKTPGKVKPMLGGLADIARQLKDKAAAKQN